MNKLALVVVMLCSLMVGAGSALAVEKTPAKIDVTKSIGDNLRANEGQYVMLILKSGGEVRGHISKVTDSMVHLTKVREPGDYFDALVHLNEIVAVALQVRGFR